MSAFAPQHVSFPHAVLTGWKLNLPNFERMAEILTHRLRELLPQRPSTMSTHRALAGMAGRLPAAVCKWQTAHASKATRANRAHAGLAPDPASIPPEQFNLLVADELRRAAVQARRLSRNSLASPRDRETAARLADLLQTLKRLHYSSNVQSLYEPAGRRALPQIDRLGAGVRPGFAAELSASASIDAGAGIGLTGCVEADATVPFGYRVSRNLTVADDGDYVVIRARHFRAGIQATAEVGLPGVVTLATAQAGIDAAGELGERYKATEAAQLYRFFGERNKHRHRLLRSAGPERRAWTTGVARFVNATAGRLLHERQLLDVDEPVHATARKHMRGMYLEPLLHRQAAALDRCAAAGPAQGLEAVMRAAYPSTRDRIEAMPDPAVWTAERVALDLPGQNAVKYQAVARNARGRAAPVRAPLRGLRITPQLAASAGISAGQLLANPALPGDPGPSVTLGVKPFTLHDRRMNRMTRLTPVVDLMNVASALDFATVLSRLKDVGDAYDDSLARGATRPDAGNVAHPHLLLMRRHDAMRQLLGSASTRCPGGHVAGLPNEPPHFEPDGPFGGLYGDPAKMPAEIRAAIAAVRSGRLAPADLLRQVDDCIAAYARQDAKFKIDATEAWALRHEPEGIGLLHRMNRDYFAGAVPLPARPASRDVTDFIGRAYDAHALALCNLGVQRSVALYEGRRNLSIAAAPGREAEAARARAEFQQLADDGASSYRARIAAHNEHNLPLTKDTAFRSSSIYTAGGNERGEFEASADLSLDAGLARWALASSWLAEPDLALGTAGVSTSFTSTHRKAALNPLTVGRFPRLELSGYGGVPFAAPHGPLQFPFTSGTKSIEWQWRVPPDAVGGPAASGRPPSATSGPSGRSLQYVRSRHTQAVNPGFKTPNLLGAMPGAALKIGGALESSVTTTAWQENGWCPAYNVLEWNRYLRPLMWDTKAGKPLPFDRIASNFADAPFELNKHFSRFNPTLRVVELFRQAVLRPEGRRNEFHRMLYDGVGARERAYCRLAALVAPASDARLFETPDPLPVFHAAADQARHWPAMSRSTDKALSALTATQRADYFLGSPEGRECLVRYMSIMEEASQYNNAGRLASRGYNLEIDRHLVASRRVVAGDARPSGVAALKARARKAVQQLRLFEEPAKPNNRASTRDRFGEAEAWC